MADDIVKRLQDLTTDLLYNPDCDDEGCGDCAWHRAVMAAIGEIERLRAVLAALAEQDDDLEELIFPNEEWLNAYFNAVVAGKEARRG